MGIFCPCASCNQVILYIWIKFHHVLFDFHTFIFSIYTKCPGNLHLLKLKKKEKEENCYLIKNAINRHTCIHVLLNVKQTGGQNKCWVRIFRTFWLAGGLQLGGRQGWNFFNFFYKNKRKLCNTLAMVGASIWKLWINQIKGH